MMMFLIGVIVAIVFYTFWPAAAAVPSAWLKKLWAKHGRPEDMP